MIDIVFDLRLVEWQIAASGVGSERLSRHGRFRHVGSNGDDADDGPGSGLQQAGPSKGTVVFGVCDTDAAGNSLLLEQREPTEGASVRVRLSACWGIGTYSSALMPARSMLTFWKLKGADYDWSATFRDLQRESVAGTHNLQAPLLLFPPSQPDDLVHPGVKPSDAVVELHPAHGALRVGHGWSLCTENT